MRLVSWLSKEILAVATESLQALADMSTHFYQQSRRRSLQVVPLLVTWF